MHGAQQHPLFQQQRGSDSHQTCASSSGMCMYGTSSITTRRLGISMSKGSHLLATWANAFRATSCSSGSWRQRSAVEWTMLGMCAAGWRSDKPGRGLACDQSEPSAARPPARSMAPRRHSRILAMAPSRSSYRKMPAAPSRVGAPIRKRNGAAGHSGEARAASSTGCHTSCNACNSSGPSGPWVKARKVMAVQCSVDAGYT
mmetsp:Transcript_47108/g.143137  ORF Transcript_47108/g.143137 Transcript_47108/m.143137 type:complete len:201 (+) Transcript_47108:302-904(+)